MSTDKEQNSFAVFVTALEYIEAHICTHFKGETVR